jgi:hypothetical protein
MKRNYIGLGILVFGIAVLANTRSVSPRAHARVAPVRSPAPEQKRPAERGYFANAYNLLLDHDVPGLGLHKGQFLKVYPEAPIYLGDVVAVRTESDTLSVAYYQDELMGCVAGLAVKDELPVFA